MTLAVDHVLVGMDFAGRQSRHAVVHAAGQFPDLRMQRAAEGHVHFLEAAADAEQRQAALDAHSDQLQRQRVTPPVIGFVARMFFGAEVIRMDIGAGAGQEHAIDGFQQGVDIGEGGIAGKDQRQRADDLGDRRQVSLADALGGKAIFGKVRAADDADHGPFHCVFLPTSSRRAGRAQGWSSIARQIFAREYINHALLDIE